MADNKRQTLMHKIQAYAFTAHECTLYLDCHPNNRKALEMHNKAVKMMNDAVNQYEEMYGPLTADSAGKRNGGWDWTNGKWPWQNEEENR